MYVVSAIIRQPDRCALKLYNSFLFVIVHLPYNIVYLLLTTLTELPSLSILTDVLTRQD